MTINYDRKITWDNFFKILTKYREQFYYGNPPEERYYLEVYKKTYNLSIENKIAYFSDILLFLNRWKCRFKKETSIIVLTNWTLKNLNNINKLAGLSIETINLSNEGSLIDNIYNSLIDTKNIGIHNMSDACASKFLHILMPELFVMWDKNIKPYKSYPYSEFLEVMQKFANDIKNKFIEKYPNQNREDFLQNELRYPIRKTFAKYIDEYNWYIAFGYARIQY